MLERYESLFCNKIITKVVVYFYFKMFQMKSFFKIVCPCFSDLFDDETPLIGDDVINHENGTNCQLNQREQQNIERESLRRSSSMRYNNSRFNKNDFKRDEETERALQQILDRTKERMINFNEFNEEINFEKLRSMMDNEKYLKEINDHDKLSKDTIKKDCLLEPTFDDENLVDLLTNASALSESDSVNINKMLKDFKTSLKTVNSINFDEPLVVYMDL
ncbi:Hypothetical protein SRAE_X000201700 [Strongyloides ratti]|uniref:Uncharacterized protein n=1 Tax=Strongyloides ratti TaxID=34506 RepID=A0A090KYK3_STRRB|nr:Hypothetical protein SRAE_X000201700 [Strongyloides ratti]CEF60279.1 Hypothetical protein SRAE_X000201700 [Strongyloides ratti]